MGMNLARALRLPATPRLALVGAGGKTTALFQLARQLPPPVIVTTTTHLHVNQIPLADSHLTALQPEALDALEQVCLQDVVLVTGAQRGDRIGAPDPLTLAHLEEVCSRRSLALLVEADGARQKPLKAPGADEPVIPAFIQSVVVVAGLSALGKPLTDRTVFRAGRFSSLSGLPLGGRISMEAIGGLLAHPDGGLRGIPEAARRLALLNQAESPELLAAGGRLAERLLADYEAVVVGSLQNFRLQTFETVGGIILAAGEAKRFGATKQLLDWHGQPFVRRIAMTALEAGLSPVIVVTGAAAERVEAALADLPLVIVRNPGWSAGQSSSLRAGLGALPGRSGAALFLLADQPQVPSSLLRALVAHHRQGLPAILAPMVGDRRANPVLFDRTTFPALSALSGDVGGRAVFSQFPVSYLPWQDEGLLVDVDLPEDYDQLTGD
jgi:molybdenum cofactor cytidylyltransferase